MTEDVLHTAIVGAEALLNSRPLTHVSVDPNNLEALTPNHFLLLRAHPGCHLDFPSLSRPSSRKRYEQAQQLITYFWNRWLREYIPNLIERRKWLRNRRNLAVNDLVLVVTPNSPRGTWPVGRVTSVTTGPDGVVRSADVKVVRPSPGKDKLPDGSPDPHITTHYYNRSVHKAVSARRTPSRCFRRRKQGRQCARRLIWQRHHYSCLFPPSLLFIPFLERPGTLA